MGALRHRDFRLFFGGQLISLIGTWMQTVAQSWLITELTDSRFLLGLISTLQFLPMLLFALVGGALADRLPKRRTLVWTQTALMLLAFALAALVWLRLVRYWQVAVLAFALGLVNTLDTPVRQAFIVEMVEGKEDLGSAIAINSAMFNGARIIGPAVAGLLIARYGVALAFFLNGVSFLPVIAALLAMRAQGLPAARRRQPILRDVAEGLRYVRRTPAVFFLFGLLLFIGLFVINFSVLVTVLARDVLHAEAAGYGYLMSALGVGALVAALLLTRQRGARLLLAPIAAAGVALSTVTALMFFARRFSTASAGLFLMGLAFLLYTALTNTSLQAVVPNDLRGRIMSIYQLLLAGTTPLGALLTGAAADRLGGSGAFLVDGGLGLLGALALILWWLAVGRRRLTAGAAGAP